MSDDIAHIAFVSPNAAFSAFAESVLGSWPDIKVHTFDSSTALAASGLTPHVIACNFEFDSGFYEGFAPVLSSLRVKGPVSVLSIVRNVGTSSRARCRVFGIDEVAVKPISPLHLGLRLAAMTKATSPSTAPRHSAEIVPFPRRRQRRQSDDARPAAF